MQSTRDLIYIYYRHTVYMRSKGYLKFSKVNVTRNYTQNLKQNKVLLFHFLILKLLFYTSNYLQ